MRCHICGRALDRLWAIATDTEYGTTADRFRYFLCPDCDCLCIDPLPAHRLGEIYPDTYYSFESAGTPLAGGNPVTRVKALLDRRAFREAIALVESPRRILDEGGGRGEFRWLAAAASTASPAASRTSRRTPASTS